MILPVLLVGLWVGAAAQESPKTAPSLAQDIRVSLSAQESPLQTESAPDKNPISALETELGKGNLFAEKTYERAEAHLKKWELFKAAEFVHREHEEGINIRFKDGSRAYVLPLFLGLSGNKHAVKFSLGTRNLFRRGENLSFSVGGGRDGFETGLTCARKKHTLTAQYRHINFHQRLYAGGWQSMKEIFSPADDKDKYGAYLLADIPGKEDDFSVSYAYQFSSVWSVVLTPQYRFYRYQHNALDTGNHTQVSAGLTYADNISPTMNIRGLDGMEHLHKAEMLRDLPRVRRGKTAQATFSAGGRWTGSAYDIRKLSVGGSYLWELKTRHIIALFAKGQYAFSAPFSDGVESADLLFGMGIYDREQRGKAGFSAGIGGVCFLVRNETGLLSVAPFYEQGFITQDGRAYGAHGGVGATIAYRVWWLPLPVSVNFTHNLNDGNHYIGLKVGGHF